jgi:uncharacterized lipoprotein YmbA
MSLRRVQAAAPQHWRQRVDIAVKETVLKSMHYTLSTRTCALRRHSQDQQRARRLDLGF